MITSVELENWKAHSNTTIHFSKGTNILIGQMGAGKSSILDAISFALFGTFPAIKNRRIKVEDVIRSKPAQQSSAKLRLGFDADGSSYVVERVLSTDGPAKATLTKNGTYVQSQPQRVTEEIERALKVDYDTFSRAVYSEQNRLDYFLELSSSDRKKQIDNLLGLDRFAAAQENSTSLITRIKTMVEDSERTVKNFDIARLNDQLAKLSEEFGKLSTEREEAEKNSISLKTSAETAEKELSSMKANLERKIMLEKNVAELRSRISVLAKEISSANPDIIKEPAELAKLISESEANAAKLRKEFTSASESLQVLQSRVAVLKNQMSDAEKRMKERDELNLKTKGKSIQDVRNALENISRELEAIDNDYAKFRASAHEAEKSLAELRGNKGKCPICDSELTSEKRDALITARNTTIAAAGANMLSLSKSRSEKKDSILRLNAEANALEVMFERLKDYVTLDEKYALASKDVEKLNVEIAKARELHKQLEKKLLDETERISGMRMSLETSERIRKHIADRELFSKDLAEKEKDILSMHVDTSSVEARQKQYTALVSELAQKRAVAESARKACIEKESQIKDKNEEISRVNSILEELKAKKSSIDDLSKFRNSLAETQSVLRKRLVSSINETMHNIWPELYPYADYTGVMLSAGDSDYELQLKTSRGGEIIWENANSLASGGERSIACMAMRIAFSLVLVPNLRWLILDEPTHNIDNEGISKFVRLLNEVLPNLVDQTFVITHDEQLKQVSNGRIYILSRNKAEHAASSVIEL